MKSQRPNLLYLVHRFPYPPNRGDRIRSFHLLKHLVEHFNVYLGTLWDEEPTQGELEVLHELCEQVAAFPIHKSRRWMRAARSLACGNSATEGLFKSPELKKQVRVWSEEVKFDLGFVYCSSMVQYLNEVKELPAIVDLVDVDSQKWFDYAEKTNGWKRLLFNLEGRRLRKFECSLPARCRSLMLVSEAEAKLFRSFCPNDNIFGISNGVDLEYFNSDHASASLPSSTCVFVGALDYRANIQGLEWFCQHCWPAIHQQLPNAMFDLVGRNPVAAVSKLAEIPGVRLVGQVPDVRPYVRSSAMAVVPLLTARGIQNKVLEAMAMGAAVVASPQAIEGIDCQVDEHVLRVAAPAEWIETIVNLFKDQPKQRSLGSAARKFVEENYSWSARLTALQPLLTLGPEQVGSKQSWSLPEMSPHTDGSFEIVEQAS